MDDARQHPFAVTEVHADKLAVIMHESGVTRTYGELSARSKKLAQVFHDAGLRQGDHLAVLLDNRPEFFEIIWAGLSSGLYVTPVNWHLTADEAAFIAIDCGARAIVSAASLDALAAATLARLSNVAVALSVGGRVEGFDPYETVLGSGRDPEVLASSERFEACAGQWMFYSSGTTGKPKGIVPGPVGAELGRPQPFVAMQTGLFGMSPESIYLSPAPLYHAAPAGWTSGAQCQGCSVVVMESFDPERLLAAIEKHRVTHVQLVPTHLIRLLKLPASTRDHYDLSSLQYVIHAAAPCPIEVKHAALEWLGPVVYEYYAGSEGNGFCAIGPDEWLTHPGSVGRSFIGQVHIANDAGEEVPIGEEGRIWFETARQWEYHNDSEKTANAWNVERGWSTIGDVGRLDDEGYLYLTDRSSNLIIAGGVNIYPREIEDALIGHDAVFDVAVVGVPDDDLGEKVHAYVQLDPTVPVDVETIGDELLAYCGTHLARFKCPRAITLVDELPRLPTGKLLKRLLPAPS